MKLYHHLRAAIVKQVESETSTEEPFFGRCFPQYFVIKKHTIIWLPRKITKQTLPCCTQVYRGENKAGTILSLHFHDSLASFCLVLPCLVRSLSFKVSLMSSDNLDYIYDVLFAQKDKCGRNFTSKQKR